MRRIGIFEDKRGLSNLIAYVLLISISISLSVVVYNWLSDYADQADIEKCPDGASIVIKGYSCNGSNGNLTVRLKNKGLFSVDGYILRVHDTPDAAFGFYVFNKSGSVIRPDEEVVYSYNYSDYNLAGDSLMTVTLIEVQPFIGEGEEVSNCELVAAQKAVCS
jgi:hypothetical protein